MPAMPAMPAMQIAYRVHGRTVGGLGVWMEGAMETTIEREFRADLVEHELDEFLREHGLELDPASVRVTWGWTSPVGR
jgi:hypothetical protein